MVARAECLAMGQFKHRHHKLGMHVRRGSSHHVVHEMTVLIYLRPSVTSVLSWEAVSITVFSARGRSG